MRKIVTILSILALIVNSCNSGQKQCKISAYFDEIKVATKKYENLWDKNLYAPILLIDPETRQIFANEPDTAGVLQPDGNIYSGFLPDDVNFANTAIDWNGKRWAMIMLPLPQNKYERITLLAHELFHQAQPSLGFNLFNVDNNHLDQKDGRIFMRLEMEALKKALQTSSEKEIQQHLTNALIFRKYRNSLYPDTETTENTLELLEGLAEFTGLIISGRNKKQTKKYFVEGINTFFADPTFVRSFAYYTTPAYGYLLYCKNKNWNKEVIATTNLTNLFIDQFNINIPNDLKIAVEPISDNYNGKIIIQEETEREKETIKKIAEIKHKFIESPHFELQFEKMSISFDPSNIMPIENYGNFYLNVRVIDLWGTLTTENGALMSPFWDKISITNPTKTDGNKIIGDGWTLELTDGYIIEKDETTGNYKLTKK